MSLDQLEYFVAIAEEENIGRAARRLNISQPPLSRQLHALESELGTTLFQRTPRGVTLLPQGKVFLGHARQILSQVQAAKRALGAQAERPTPRGARPAPSLHADSAAPALTTEVPLNAGPPHPVTPSTPTCGAAASDIASPAGAEPTT